MSKPFLLFRGPVKTRSGYGAHSRDLLEALYTRWICLKLKLIVVAGEVNSTNRIRRKIMFFTNGLKSKYHI